MTMRYDVDDERVTIPFGLYVLYVFGVVIIVLSFRTASSFITHMYGRTYTTILLSNSLGFLFLIHGLLFLCSVRLKWTFHNHHVHYTQNKLKLTQSQKEEKKNKIESVSRDVDEGERKRLTLHMSQMQYAVVVLVFLVMRHFVVAAVVCLPFPALSILYTFKRSGKWSAGDRWSLVALMGNFIYYFIHLTLCYLLTISTGIFLV